MDNWSGVNRSTATDPGSVFVEGNFFFFLQTKPKLLKRENKSNKGREKI